MVFWRDKSGGLSKRLGGGGGGGAEWVSIFEMRQAACVG